MTKSQWIDLKQDADTGIETLHARFSTGHAYDPHFHDSYLVGVTEQGVQQFNCRRLRHDSTPGQVFMLEPGEIHDGEAPSAEGFAYQMLYLDPLWLEREMAAMFEQAPLNSPLSVVQTLTHDPMLADAIRAAFAAVHHGEFRIVRQTALDTFLAQLTHRLHWRQRSDAQVRMPQVARRARDYLHAHFHTDIGLDQLATACGVDRFRLNRAFRATFGLPPHAYLVQLRLAQARRQLSHGARPADVASDLGFADQSHLGRWFVRAYGLTPAAYRKHCTNLPD